MKPHTLLTLTPKEWQARPSTEEDFEFTLASAIVKSMTDAIKLDDDEVDGVVSYQLKGNVRPDALGPTQDLPGPDQGTAPESINAEIWISKNDFFVRQYRVEAGIPQIKPTFLDIAPSGIPSNIIPHSKGVKCGLIRSNSPFSYSNLRPAKPKIPKPLVYAQVSPLGTSFATP